MSRVAISGHRELGDVERMAWVGIALRDAAAELNVSHALSCLAPGADQLFAALMVETEVPLTAIIPCRAYPGTFTSAPDLVEFMRLEAAAVERITMAFEEPSPLAYEAANHALVDGADALIAVWDGLPARDQGGTAEVVAYAKLRSRKIIHINPATRTITPKLVAATQAVMPTLRDEAPAPVKAPLEPPPLPEVDDEDTQVDDELPRTR